MRQKINFEQTIFALLLLLIILTAIPYGTVEPWWESAFIIYIFTIFGWWALRDGFRNSWTWKGKTITLPLVFLALFAYFQSLEIWMEGESGGGWRAISFDREASWFFAVKLLSLIIFIELLWRFAPTERRLKILASTIVGVAAISSLFGLIRGLFLHGSAEFFLSGLKPGAGFAQFINRNHFALLMLMSAGFAFGFIIGEKSRQLKIFYVGLLVILTTGLALSVSRGGVLAFIGQVLFLLLLYSSGVFTKSGQNYLSVNRIGAWKIARQAIISIVLLVFIIGGVIWIGDERMAHRFETLPQETGFQENDTGDRRINLWAASFELFKEYPVAGIGFGGYKYAITRHFEYSGYFRFEQAHNDYLELLTSGGVIGAALAIWFVIAVIKKAGKEINDSSGEVRAIKLGALTGLVGVLIHSFFDFGLHTTINSLVSVTLVAVLTGHFEKGKPEA